MASPGFFFDFRAEVLQRVCHRRSCWADWGQSQLFWRHRLTTTRLRLRRIGHWGGLLQNSLCWRVCLLVRYQAHSVCRPCRFSTCIAHRTTAHGVCRIRRAVVGQHHARFSNSHAASFPSPLSPLSHRHHSRSAGPISSPVFGPFAGK